MAKIKSEILNQLFSELRFAPGTQQQKQLANARDLALIAEKEKQYPFEFICFRLTGYRPREDLSGKFIEGADLIHDLQIIINKISRKVAPVAADHPEKLYTIEELARQMNVSTKTIRRWRQKGLMGWMFIFDGGKKMLGFPQSSVDEFMENNPEITDRASKFTQLSDDEKKLILEVAEKIAKNETLSRYQVILRTAEKTGRAVETIRCLLIDFEKGNPQKTFFNKAAGVIRPHDAKTIHRLYTEGTSVKELMARYNRSRSSIHRIINQRRLKNLSRMKIEFIDSGEFSGDDAYENIIGQSDELVVKLSASSGFLLNRQQEVLLFRRYNYLKFLAWTGLEKIASTRLSGKLLSEVERFLETADVVKKLIIEANMGLVVSVAKKHLQTGASMPDLVSEGNMSLMRAVEKFDYSRGYRFSTYGTLAIAKDYARNIPAEAHRADRAASMDMTNISQDVRSIDLADIIEIESAGRSLDQVIKDNLTEREQYIIRNHFGLEGNRIIKKAKTLEEIGRTLNLSRERVRQIELIALQQLRHCLSPEQFDLLTK